MHPKLSSDSRGCKQPRYSCSIAHLSGSESDSRHSAKIVLQAVNPPYILVEVDFSSDPAVTQGGAKPTAVYVHTSMPIML